MVERGTLFAVCCTAEIPAELMNRILDESYNFFQPPAPRLVVLDDLDKTFTDASEPPLDDGHPFPALFKGKTPEACAAAVKDHVARTGSNINWECFAILDERTARDYTALLCVADDEAGEVETLRAAAEITSVKLTVWDVGHSSLSEDSEIAEKDEGKVLRMRRPTPKGPPPPPKEGEPAYQEL